MEHFLIVHGYLALVLLAFVEACCVPIPSEVTFGFAGVLAYEGHLNIVLIILIGSLAELAGSFVSYSVGRFGGRPLVERLGRYVLLTTADLDRAERWFSGRGEYAIAVGRAMPVLRAFVSIVAGISDMPAVKFGIFSLLGTLAYASALTAIGYSLGSTWTTVRHDFSLAGYVLVAIVVIVVVAFIAHRLSERRKQQLVH